MTGDTLTYSYFRGDKAPKFATETEYEAARMLDYYRVPWDYEPRTFILEQERDGDIKAAFTPDFYLPELDLYIEVTQMKQSLVTEKNRKVRKLKEKYPEINIKILYRKDFVQLAKKYNLDPPSEGTGVSCHSSPKTGGSSWELRKSKTRCRNWEDSSLQTTGCLLYTSDAADDL